MGDRSHAFCPYEIVGVAADASADDIKRAYRSKALILHPDKNPEDIQQATVKFTLLQKAFEILSDPIERAWFDGHRTSVCKGANGQLIDLMAWFDPSIFDSMDDSASGFYTVYRSAFEKIAAYEGGGASNEFPSFASQHTPWEPAVRRFYSVWSNFSSKASFSFADKYNLNRIDATFGCGTRQMRRTASKENTRARDEERRKYNETVRRLVEFVKKRDMRYHAAKRAEAEATQQAIHSRLHQHTAKYAIPLAQLQTFDAEYSQLLAQAEDEEHFCYACNVAFRSAEQLVAHEEAIVHRMNVLRLREEFEQEDEAERLKKERQRSLKGKKKKIVVQHEQESSELEDGQEQGEGSKGVIVAESNARSDSQNTAGDNARSDIQNVAGDNARSDIQNIESQDNDLQILTQPKLTLQEKRERRRERQAKKCERASLTCQICEQIFVSRTKLFVHLDAEHR